MGTAENKRLVGEWFERLGAGDPRLPELLADDATWWVPPSSHLAGTHAGKPAVLALLRAGVDHYSPKHPMQVEVERMIAEGDWVAVEFVLRAVTARGRDYANHYHFAFRARDGRIAEVREHLDTKAAHDAFQAPGS